MIKNLKPGVTYTIKGSFKMTSGLGLYTEGQVTHKFPKDSVGKRTMPKTLTLNEAREPDK